MKKLILKIFGFSNEEIYLFNSIKSARNVQDFLWGEYNTKWDLEEWKRMFTKRMIKITDIDKENPHAKIELKKRILQNTALGIAMLEKMDSDKIYDKCEISSNLPHFIWNATIEELTTLSKPVVSKNETLTLCDRVAFADYIKEKWKEYLLKRIIHLKNCGLCENTE